MSDLPTLALGCPHCGARTTLHLAEWKPEAPVKTKWPCQSCKALVEMELPGRVMWVGSLRVLHNKDVQDEAN